MSKLSKQPLLDQKHACFGRKSSVLAGEKRRRWRNARKLPFGSFLLNSVF
jgi:hypothetical protein